jgi:deoxyribonuclease-2
VIGRRLPQTVALPIIVNTRLAIQASRRNLHEAEKAQVSLVREDGMHLSALDENGKLTDWWFLYKVPKMTKDAQTDSTSGYEYVYFDDKAKAVSRSPNKLTDGKGALDLTLASLFKKPDATTGWILYNDELPADVGRSDSGSLGHTKGVIGFDTSTDSGFWLLHSWPKYADPGAVGLPTPMYGQTFMCITINLATANQIASQMITHQQPQVYDTRLPASLTLPRRASYRSSNLCAGFSLP